MVAAAGPFAAGGPEDGAGARLVARARDDDRADALGSAVVVGATSGLSSTGALVVSGFASAVTGGGDGAGGGAGTAALATRSVPSLEDDLARRNAPPITATTASAIAPMPQRPTALSRGTSIASNVSVSAGRLASEVTAAAHMGSGVTGAISTLGLPTTSPNEYTGLAIDSAGRILVANPGNKQIHREKTAGGGSSTTGWDNLLTGGILNRPRDVVEGLDGALYVTGAGDPSPASSADHRIVRITLSGATGTGTTYFGSNGPGYLGDGGPITNARIDITPQPIDVKTVGSAVFIRTTVNIIRGLNGELIFTDTNNNAIRRIR